MGGERVIAGRYRLSEPVGTGGMASVWAADDTVLDRRVALKLLGRDADRRRFGREARVAAALSHPNVVRVYDYGDSDEGEYIVFELVPGGTLEDRFEPGRPLPDDEAARIAAGIAEGLAYAHAQGLVHRDLKPANVLFDAEDRPKVADFGIARLSGAGTLTEAGTVLGTAAYISPEQAAGETATPASDVYSFGVILYRMLTGRLPFEANDPMELAAMHIHEEPPPASALRPDVPARLESVAAAALAKDPADRPRNGSALLTELGATAATVPLAPEQTAVIPGAAPRSRRAAGALAAVVLLAGAGVALGLVATRNTHEQQAPRAPILPATSARTTEATEPAPAPAPEPTSETRETTTQRTTTAAPAAPPVEPVPTETLPPTAEIVPTETGPGPPVVPPGQGP